jgi:hypothetical protein
VYLGSIRTGALALAMAVTLGGCGPDLTTDQGWFRKPMDFVGRNSGYTYSDLQESGRLNRPITDADLVDGNGACPASAAAPPTAPSDQAASPGAPANPPQALGEGVGLGMSECEVVARAGQPNNVQVGKAPNGDRTALLTYDSGPRPGIYHFERGRLMQMDRVDVPPPPPPPKVAKKKPAKPKKQTANNNAT